MPKNHSGDYKTLTRNMQRLKERIPTVMKNFAELHSSGVAAGVLTSKTKELVALGIAIAVHCDGCITYHVHDALKAGASPQEILETIGVAILMGGGPSVVYGCEAMEAIDQFVTLGKNGA